MSNEIRPVTRPEHMEYCCHHDVQSKKDDKERWLIAVMQLAKDLEELERDLESKFKGECGSKVLPGKLPTELPLLNEYLKKFGNLISEDERNVAPAGSDVGNATRGRDVEGGYSLSEGINKSCKDDFSRLSVRELPTLGDNPERMLGEAYNNAYGDGRGTSSSVSGDTEPGISSSGSSGSQVKSYSVPTEADSGRFDFSHITNPPKPGEGRFDSRTDSLPGSDTPSSDVDLTYDLKSLDSYTMIMLLQEERVGLIEGQVQDQSQKMKNINENIKRHSNAISRVNSVSSGLKEGKDKTEIDPALRQELESLGVEVPEGRVSKDQLNAMTETLKSKRDGLNNDSQMEMIRLQGLINKQQQAYQLMTNMQKKQHDTMMSIINKIG